MSVLLAGIFILLIGVFSSYGCHVYRRNKRIEMAADRYNKVVTSLFPGGMHDRILEDEDDEKEEKTHGKNRLKTYLGMEKNSNRSADHDDDFYKSKPMADLFTDTTVLFADIAGFTAWSSTREPTQVFILLETIYKAFDEIARNRGVFKVETVGDCYVAGTKQEHFFAVLNSRNSLGSLLISDLSYYNSDWPT